MLNEEEFTPEFSEDDISWPEVSLIDLRTGPKGPDIYYKYRQIGERAAIIKEGLNKLQRIPREDIPEHYIALSPTEIKKICAITRPSDIRRLEEDFIYSILVLLEDETQKSAIGEVYISKPRNNSRNIIVVRKNVFDSFLKNRHIEVNKDNIRLDFLENGLRELKRRYPQIAEEIFEGNLHGKL
ncbi:MAG: hypothetical protein ACYDAS_00870 [Patescibacteria group bacterium]